VLGVGSGGILAKCVMIFGPHLCLFREISMNILSLNPTPDLSLLFKSCLGCQGEGCTYIQLAGTLSTKPRLELYNRVS
jgi:hypothetical protein